MSCCELRDKKSFGKIFTAFLTGYLLRIKGPMDRTEMIQDSMIFKSLLHLKAALIISI